MSCNLKQWLRDQVTQFASRRTYHQMYANALKATLTSLCKERGVSATVESRAKEVSSFAEKAIRKEKYRCADPVNRMTDLCGARVITDTDAEASLVAKTIRERFSERIDEANSEDKLALLGAGQFGYLSVHFVVMLDPATLGIEGKEFLDDMNHFAEIQVRTGLQHVWANIGHDRIYKSPFPVATRWQRELNRAAALLEDADRTFSRVLEGLEDYSTRSGLVMDRERLQQELDLLETISDLQRDPALGSKRVTALRQAALYRRLGSFQRMVDVLGPFEDEKDPALLRELATAMYQNNPSVTDAPVQLLLRAIELEPTDAEAHGVLGQIYERDSPLKAQRCFEAAHMLRPNNPYYFLGLLEFEIGVSHDAGTLSLLFTGLQRAIRILGEHCEIGLEVPVSWFSLGKACLLTGDSDQAFAATSQGIGACLDSAIEVPGNSLQQQRRAIERLAVRRDRLKGFLEIEKLIELACLYKYKEHYSARALTGPVVILAGSTAPIAQPDVDRYRGAVVGAFERLRGTLLCGSTKSGVCGIAGDIFDLKGSALQVIGYTPQLLPFSFEVDRTRRHEVRSTVGRGFSMLESLEMWFDILGSSVDFSDVRLLAIGGGRITLLEIRLALALGAKVGIFDDAGRASKEALRDRTICNNPNLIVLPHDRESIRMFVNQGGRNSREGVLAASVVEEAAKTAHARYVGMNAHSDKSMQPWNKLDERYKQANRGQIDGALEILRLNGFALVPSSGSLPLITLSEEEIERMAEMEHGRWNIERLQSGWRFGPQRDLLLKTSPYLIPWASLPDNIRQYDRTAVAAWPEIFENAGFSIARSGEAS